MKLAENKNEKIGRRKENKKKVKDKNREENGNQL